jgi:lysophospholipase L1-like esterase
MLTSVRAQAREPKSAVERAEAIFRMYPFSCRQIVNFSKLGSRIALGLAATLAISPIAHAADSGNWIGAWTAAVQPVWDADFGMPTGIPASLWNQTIRQVARLSIGGRRVRVMISNEYGKIPLKIGDAHVGLAADGGKIQPGSDRALTFGGNPSIEIPAGAPAISDPVDLAVAPLSLLSVSLFLPEISPTTTMHWYGAQTAYVAAGDKAADVDFKADSTQTARLFLSEIFVDAPANARAIVALGDSITDGEGSTVDGNDRWPDRLAERLVAAGGPPVAVLNQGISGAKVLADRMGVNALARFDRDVLNQPKVDTIILMMGINDIGWSGSEVGPHQTTGPRQADPTADEIIDGYKQLIARAHLHGLRIIGATLTPFGDAMAGTPSEGFYTPEKEQRRAALNAFIRSGAFDGVIDFEPVVLDPQRPQYILAKFGKGDHLHPNHLGYAAMAAAIDLNLLVPTK